MPQAANGLELKQIGHYQISRKIADGGFGTVYLAHDPRLKREVAIKLLHPHHAADPARVARFLREARSAARLQNPGIVQVFDVIEIEGRMALVMEFVEGQTLDAYIKDHPGLSLADKLELAAQIAETLDIAHQAGIIHRDVKPANVMIDAAGRAKLTDFSLARLLDSSLTQLTGENNVLGTPAYMSPEQCEGLTAVPQSDLYALGIMIYEMATGDLPFEAENYLALLRHHMDTPPTPIRLLKPSIPDALEALIMRCLAKSPEDRPTSGAELARTLRDLVAQGIGRPEESQGRRAAKTVELSAQEIPPAAPAASAGASPASSTPQVPSSSPAAPTPHIPIHATPPPTPVASLASPMTPPSLAPPPSPAPPASAGHTPMPRTPATGYGPVAGLAGQDAQPASVSSLTPPPMAPPAAAAVDPAAAAPAMPAVAPAPMQAASPSPQPVSTPDPRWGGPTPAPGSLPLMSAAQTPTPTPEPSPWPGPLQTQTPTGTAPAATPDPSAWGVQTPAMAAAPVAAPAVPPTPSPTATPDPSAWGIPLPPLAEAPPPGMTTPAPAPAPSAMTPAPGTLVAPATDAPTAGAPVVQAPTATVAPAAQVLPQPTPQPAPPVALPPVPPQPVVAATVVEAPVVVPPAPQAEPGAAVEPQPYPSMPIAPPRATTKLAGGWNTFKNLGPLGWTLGAIAAICMLFVLAELVVYFFPQTGTALPGPIRRIATSSSSPLSDYVKAQDSRYAYSVKSEIPGEGYMAYVLEMTSQAWHPDETKPPTWRHWITIIAPDRVTTDIGMLVFASGLSTPDEPLREVPAQLAQLAVTSHSVITLMEGFPLSSPGFYDTAGQAKDVSAERFAVESFLRAVDTGDMTWSLVCPLVKAAVEAMDTVQSFLPAEQGGGNALVKRFMLTGAANGWCAWLTGAVDDRVAAVAPIQFDLLNISRQIDHQVGLRESLSPYLALFNETGLMPALDTQAGKNLLALIDPYEYRNLLTVPKLLVVTTSSPFAATDSVSLFFDDLAGDKYLLYVPNASVAWPDPLLTATAKPLSEEPAPEGSAEAPVAPPNEALTPGAPSSDASSADATSADAPSADAPSSEEGGTEEPLLSSERPATFTSSAFDTLRVFYHNLLVGKPMPRFRAQTAEDGSFQLFADDRPAEVRLWIAESNKRDFRFETIGASWFMEKIKPETNGVYQGQVAHGAGKFRAFFLELVYPSKLGVSFSLATPIKVVAPKEIPSPHSVFGHAPQS